MSMVACRRVPLLCPDRDKRKPIFNADEPD